MLPWLGILFIPIDKTTWKYAKFSWRFEQQQKKKQNNRLFQQPYSWGSWTPGCPCSRGTSTDNNADLSLWQRAVGFLRVETNEKLMVLLGGGSNWLDQRRFWSTECDKVRSAQWPNLKAPFVAIDNTLTGQVCFIFIDSWAMNSSITIWVPEW